MSGEQVSKRARTASHGHRCPAPGCWDRLPFHVFACRRHWRSLPPALRETLLESWHDGDLEIYARAREAALDFLRQ